MKRTSLDRKGGSLKRTPLDKGDAALAARSPLKRGNSKLDPGKKALQTRKPLSAGTKGLSQGTGLKTNKPLKAKTQMKAKPKVMTPEEVSCREVVTKRSQGLCEICANRPATDMAHRLAVSQGGKWMPSNILHACRNCHEYNHDHPVNSFEYGWHLRSGSDPLECPVFLRFSNGCEGWIMLKDDGTKVSHS